MGRHARGAAHPRLPVARLMLGVLILLGLALVSWAAFRPQPAPQPTAVLGSAVVVASLACPDGTGGSAGTLVDVQDPLGGPAAGTVRASVDACGYREGQQVAIAYVPGDPTQVTLAGSGRSGDDANATETRLLPFGIAIAALLALGAALAVLLDGRRARRRGRGQRTAAHSQLGNADDGAGGIAWFPRRSGLAHGDPTNSDPIGSEPIGSEPIRSKPIGGVDHIDRADAVPEQDGAQLDMTDRGVGDPGARDSGVCGSGADDSGGRGPLSVVTVLPAPTYQVAGGRSSSDANSAPDGREVRLSSIDLIFPFSANLAASLHDELFTHRSPVG